MWVRIISMVLLSMFCCGLHSQDWKIFNSTDGRFSVLSPGYMEEKRAAINSGIGNIEITTLYYNQKDTTGNFLYLVNYYDLPEGMLPKDSSELILEFLLNTMDQAVSDIDGNIQYSSPIKMGSYQGLMWRSRSDVQVVKSRAYVIRDTFYMLQVFSIPDKALNKDVDRFLESFTLRTS